MHTNPCLFVRFLSAVLYRQSAGKKHNAQLQENNRNKTPDFPWQTAASSSQLFKLSAATVVSLDLDLLLKRRAKKSCEDHA
jgi:hypothetical protein